ncbi:hypothetical protein FHU41_000121 [Psychromicrobium silvestre]|uniref:Uncharacterized protein n=1 Tax=Psychromicrobium silvestre TaxID=1645614 RepID=A0A7Y9LQU1_9MICC|nr:hypothetical protein [Psychromicrobium silvestre]
MDQTFFGQLGTEAKAFTTALQELDQLHRRR